MARGPSRGYIIFKDGGTSWYPSRLDVYLNLWFADYDKAREARRAEGGYPLPYKKHCFVCSAGATRSIGLDPEDPDRERVGWDRARPKDEDLPAALREAGQVRGRAVAIELESVGILR